MSSHSEHHPHAKSHGFEGTRHYYPQRRHFLRALFAKQNLLVRCVLAHIRQYLKGRCKHVIIFFADRSLIRSAPMERSPAPIDSSSDDEFAVAPPFTAIGRSIPSMSWLNKQLESGGDRPGVRGEEQNLKGEQPQGTRDALRQASSRSEALSYKAPRGYKLQTAR
jgi:hypothetical protein